MCKSLENGREFSLFYELKNPQEQFKHREVVAGGRK
jgi:hypothetical protein